ncbi:MAG: hypothetical protein KGI60_02945 [Patescibacteria group bacterium]|nr:hypothetical protein [Patescibacteria group bacterium]
MDGVLIDHTAVKREVAAKFGLSLTPAQTPSDIMYRMLPLENWHAVQHMLYDDPEYAFRSPVMAGVVPVLETIARRNIPFVLISRRRQAEGAIRLLSERGLWPRFFNEKNTSFVRKPEDKNARAAEWRVTHYIDDERRVLDALVSVPNRFLFDPYRASSEENKYPHLSGWPEFLHKL